MKRLLFSILLFILCIQLFSQDLTGMWSSHPTDEDNISVRFGKNSNGLYLLSVKYRGDYVSFIETKREQQKVNNEIESVFSFDFMSGKKTDLFKDGIYFTYYTKSYTDVPNEINIRSRNYIYRYEAWNIYRKQEYSNNRNLKINTNNNNPSYSSSSNYRPSNTYQAPKETQLPCINASFASHGNFDIYKFTSYGTFTYRHFYYVQKYNSYGSHSVERESTENGTYKIMENNVGKKYVYLRFENGREKKGVLVYKSNSVEFHIDRKVHREQ